MQLPPAAVLASWPTPNYTDPVTRGHAVLIVNIVCICLAFLVTLLRVYTRIWITATPGIDDIFVVIGLIFAIAMIVITSIATEHWGFNRHIWDVPTTWLPTAEKLNLSWQLMFSWAGLWTKFSLLWFCRRLLGPSKGGLPIYNWAFIGSMIFVTISVLLFTFFSIFQCSPVKAYWDVDPQYPHSCLNDGAIVFSASVINLLTDGLVTILPMPLIWRLKLPIRQRIAVISIFALGGFVNVAGTCRTVWVWKSQISGYDQTWDGWPVLLSASIETTLGLICSSAPALRPLITSFLPRLLSSRRDSSYPYALPQSNKSNKFWSTTSRSRNSKMLPNIKTQPGYESDQYGILCTVEMGWSSRAVDQSDAIGTESRIASPSHMDWNESKVSPVTSTSKKPSDATLREAAWPLKDHF